jgi:glycerophosphoryl diester phosphodiesterase
VNALRETVKRVLRRSPDRPLVVAHRGSSRFAPENTLTAFELAVEEGADAVEFDVRLTADEELVVMHDARLGRTVPDMNLVSRVTAEEVSSLDAGKWLAPEFRGELVPLLDEALATLRGRAVPIIEIKDGGALGVRSAQVAAEILRREGMLSEVLVASRWTEPLDVIARSLPNTPRVVIAARHKAALASLSSGASGCLVWWRAFAKDLAKKARENAAFVAPWVVPNDRVRILAEAGADAILTDEPRSVLTILEESS